MMFVDHLAYYETRDSKEKLGYMYLFFGIPGLILLIILAYLTPDRMEYYRNGTKIKAERVVPPQDNPYIRYGSLTFAYINGSDTVLFSLRGDTESNYRMGKTYTFYYLNNDLSTAKSSLSLMFPFLFLGSMGGTFAGIGFIPYIYQARNRRQNRRFFDEFPWIEISEENIDALTAVITRIKRNYLPHSSMFYPQWDAYYTLECASPDHSRTFESRAFWLNPKGAFREGDEVAVFFDKTNPNRYIVDVNGLFAKISEGCEYEPFK